MKRIGQAFGNCLLSETGPIVSFRKMLIWKLQDFLTITHDICVKFAPETNVKLTFPGFQNQNEATKFRNVSVKMIE